MAELDPPGIEDPWVAWSGRVNRRLAKLEKENKQLREHVRMLEEETLPEVIPMIVHGILDKNMALRVRGIWDESKTYHPGECVTDHGSLFVCVKDTEKGDRPNRGLSWKLMVKNGSAPNISRTP